MTVKCVDLSHYQSGFDFKAFKDAGGLAVILKASEGTAIRDSCYNDFRSSAHANNLALASYHFLRPGDMDAQAVFFYYTVVPNHGERMVVDWEVVGITTDDVVQFLQKLQSLDSTLQLTVYSGATAKRELINQRKDWLADNTSLWVSQYADFITWPRATWPNWSLWQYTDKGEVPGFSGFVDCNRFNGSDEQMLKWFGPAAQPKVVDASSEPPEVRLEVKGNVTIFINGIKYGVFPGS